MEELIGSPQNVFTIDSLKNTASAQCFDRTKNMNSLTTSFNRSGNQRKFSTINPQLTNFDAPLNALPVIFV